MHFKNTDFNDLMRVAFHEMTHLPQFSKNKVDPFWGNAYSAYLAFTPRKALTDKVYSEPYDKTLAAYKGNPMEAEAFITGDLIGEMTKDFMKEMGLFKDESNTSGNLKLLKNTYSKDEAIAQYGKFGSPHLGGINEEHNPYNHLVAATRYFEAGLKEQTPDRSQNNFGQAFRHALAAAKHSEFLIDSPAGEALKVAVNITSHPHIKKFGNSMGWSGMETQLNQAFEIFEKSPNPAVLSAAKVAHGLFLNSKVTVSGKSTKIDAPVRPGEIPPRVSETGPIVTPDRTLNVSTPNTYKQQTQAPQMPSRNGSR